MPAGARAIHVSPDGSRDATTIAGGIALASAGDSILVAQGVYPSPNPMKRGVVLSGSWNATFSLRDVARYPSVVDGTTAAKRSAIDLPIDSDSTTIVEGFWLVGSPDFGLWIGGGDPIVRENVMRGNFSGGIRCQGPGSPRLIRNTVLENGSGVFLRPEGDTLTTFAQNLIVLNQAYGIWCDTPGLVAFASNNVWQSGTYGGFCTEQTGQNGNVSMNPRLCDSTGTTLTLLPDSPCLAENAAGGLAIGALVASCDTILITAVSPGIQLYSDTSAVTLLGYNFRAGAVARLVRPGSPEIVSKEVFPLSTREMRAHFDLFDAQPGPWDVRVDNRAGGSGLAPAAFRVVVPAIDSLVPSRIAYFDSSWVSIRGSAFLPGCRAGATRAGHPNATTLETITVSPTEARARFGAFCSLPGPWDIQIENPDGRGAASSGALEVQDLSLAAVVPETVGYVDRRLTIAGSALHPKLALEIRHDGARAAIDSIVAPLSESVSVGVDLANEPAGAWDVSVTNPDGLGAALANAFVLVDHPIVSRVYPPLVSPTMLPADLEIHGHAFAPGAMATFIRAGLPEIAVETAVISSKRLGVQVDFPVDSGAWDLRVVNPDGRQGAAAAAVTLLPAGAAVVPIDFATIQTAVDGVPPGSFVAVLPGEYEEAITLKQGVTLASTGGPAVTKIIGNSALATVIVFGAAEGAIEGFRIVGSIGTGRALLLRGTTIAVRGNWIEGNSSMTSGGGILCSFSESLIEGNRIMGNASAEDGGGIFVTDMSPVIRGNLLAGNSAAGDGGAIAVAAGASPLIEGNTIVANTAARGGGVAIQAGAALSVIERNVIASNTGGGVWLAPRDTLGTFRRNDVWGNAGGDYAGAAIDRTGVDENLSVDPVFCDTLSGNYHLGDCSPLALLPGGGIGAFGVGCRCGDLPAPPVDPVILPSLPGACAAFAALPNPAAGALRFRFTLPAADATRITIYDTAGRVVRLLLRDTFPAGHHEAEWDGKDEEGRRVASGVYIARLQTDHLDEKRRITLLR